MSTQFFEQNDDPFHSEHGCTETSVDGVKGWLRNRFEAGEPSSCPCCGGTVQRYARSLNASMIQMLVLLDRGGAMNWRTIAQATGGNGSGDAAKMRLWGLVEQKDEKWEILPTGRYFLRGQLARDCHCRRMPSQGMPGWTCVLGSGSRC